MKYYSHLILITQIIAFITCAAVAVTSELAIISALWGFSAGIWFMLTLKTIFNDILNPHQESKQPW